MILVRLLRTTLSLDMYQSYAEERGLTSIVCEKHLHKDPEYDGLFMIVYIRSFLHYIIAQEAHQKKGTITCSD